MRRTVGKERNACERCLAKALDLLGTWCALVLGGMRRTVGKERNACERCLAKALDLLGA
ncbi:MAG: hypothetical protein IKA53_05295 [Clostridia bacterium]|nr:hypothetical protein [Clostridia bacterium]